MKPPPPGPVNGLSHTQETHAAATHASTALPPASSTRAPASAVSGWPAATAPRMHRTLIPKPLQRLTVSADTRTVGQHAHDIVSRVGRRGLVAAGGLLVMLTVLVATPQLLGSRVDAAVGSLHQASPRWLWIAGRRLPAVRARRGGLLAVGDPPVRREAVARRRVRPLRRRLARQHLRPGPGRRRAQDRIVLAHAAEPRAALDERRRVRGARGLARGRARGARRRRLARRGDAALAAVRPARAHRDRGRPRRAREPPPSGRTLLARPRRVPRARPRAACRRPPRRLDRALHGRVASPRRRPSARRSASASRSRPRS